MKKTKTGHTQEQPLNCCVMTMGIKHAEQLVLLFRKTRVMQLMNQLSEQAQHLLSKQAQIAQLSDYRLLFLLPSYTRLDALRLVYDLDDCCDAIAQQLYAAQASHPHTCGRCGNTGAGTVSHRPALHADSGLLLLPTDSCSSILPRK